MSTAQVKNIILAILALLNAFLLVLVLADRVEERESRETAESAIVSVFRRNGITISEDVELTAETPAVVTVTRSQDTEYELVERLLGSSSAEPLGGNIWFYSGKNGQAQFRGTGEYDVVVTGGISGSDTAKSAKKVMNRLGMELDDSLTLVSGSTVTVTACWDGLPVYNAVTTFTFYGGEEAVASGTRVFDTVTSSSADGVMSSYNALIRFLELVETEGYVCSEITSLSAGYIMSVSVSGESTLDPVWHVAADTVELYINAVTGRIETVD